MGRPVCMKHAQQHFQSTSNVNVFRTLRLKNSADKVDIFTYPVAGCEDDKVLETDSEPVEGSKVVESFLDMGGSLEDDFDGG